MKRLQHLSVIMESVPVLWDGDYRVVDAMVGGVLGVRSQECEIVITMESCNNPGVDR